MQLRLILGHGASGTAASMQPWVDGLARRGLDAAALDLPRGAAGRAVPVFLAAIGADPSGAVPGGHSFGGRVASIAAAELAGAGSGPAALVLLSYPLHRPGRPETWVERTGHWPRIDCPVLLLSGESDPFARIDLLREAVGKLRDARLVTYPRVGHGLLPVLDAALDEAASFIASISAVRTTS